MRKSLDTGAITDPRDGRTYKIVRIGSQVWMAENLHFQHANAKCYENNLEYAEKYGLLYNWETAMKVAPPGWHLPSDEEWQALVDLAGGNKIAGTKLKAKKGWDNNGNGTDDFEFSALLGGFGSSYGDFCGVVYDGRWWGSESKFNRKYACSWQMGYHSESAGWFSCLKSNLNSVRCVLDVEKPND